MRARARPVHKGLAQVVHRAEVQQHALARPVVRQREGAPVPHGRHEVALAHAAQLALGTEGHVYAPAQLALQQPPRAAGVAPVDLKLPFAVQVYPVRPPHLRARVLAAKYFHDIAPFLSETGKFPALQTV